RWRPPACSRMTLPVPVSRKRFLAPLCVFIFGMVADLLRVVPGVRGGTRRSKGGAALRPGSLRCRCLGLGSGLLAGRIAITRAALLGLGLGLLLRRPDDHDHVAAVLLGSGLD